MIHAADAFAQATHRAGESRLGIRVEHPRSISRRPNWKDGIVGRLTGGVGALLKKNGVQVVQGRRA